MSVLLIKREPVIINQCNLVHVDVYYNRCEKNVFSRHAYIKGKRYEINDDNEIV